MAVVSCNTAAIHKTRLLKSQETSLVQIEFQLRSHEARTADQAQVGDSNMVPSTLPPAPASQTTNARLADHTLLNDSHGDTSTLRPAPADIGPTVIVLNENFHRKP